MYKRDDMKEGRPIYTHMDMYIACTKFTSTYIGCQVYI